jgi:hypothetical protein
MRTLMTANTSLTSANDAWMSKVLLLVAPGSLP